MFGASQFRNLLALFDVPNFLSYTKQSFHIYLLSAATTPSAPRIAPKRLAAIYRPWVMSETQV